MAPKTVATLLMEVKGNIANFQASMEQTAKSVEKFGRRMSSIGGGLSKVLTLPLAGVGAAALKAAVELDEAFDKIRVGTGAVGDRLEQLKGDFKEAFGDATQSAGDVGTAIADLNTGLGLAGKPLEELSKQVLAVSEITGQDLPGAIKGTVSVMNAWKVATDQQGNTMDFLFKTSQATGIGFNELAAAVAKGQPVFRTLGIDLQHGAVYLGQLGKAGIESGVGLAGLTRAVSVMSKAGVKDLGAGLSSAIERIRSMSDVSKATALSIGLFGKAAGPVLVDAIRSGKLSVDDMVNTLNNSGESIIKARDETRDFGEKLKVFRNQLELAFEPIGTPIFQALGDTLTAITPLVKQLGDAFAALPKSMQTTIVAFGAIAAAIGPTMVVVGSSIAGFVKIGSLLGAAGTLIAGALPAWVSLSGAMTAVSAAAALVGGALALLVTPLGLLAAAVGLAIAAWYKWDVLKPYWDDLSAAFSGFVESFKQNLANIAAYVQGEALGAWQSFSDNFSLIINNLPTVAAMAWEAVKQAFSDGAAKVLAVLEEIKAGIENFASNAFAGLKESATSAMDGVYAAVQGLKASLFDQSPIPEMQQGFQAFGQSIGPAIVPPVQAATAAVESLFDKLANGGKKATGEATASAKQLGDAWKKTLNDIQDAARDVTGVLDPLTQELTDLMKAQDFAGIQKLAEGFRGSKESLDNFRSSLRDAKSEFKDFEQEQEQAAENFKDMQREIADAAGIKIKNPLADEIQGLLSSGNISGLEEIASEMSKSSDETQKFAEALSEAKQQMGELAQEGDAIGDAFSDLFESFGISGRGAKALSGGLAALITQLAGGGSSGTSGFFGDLLGGMMNGYTGQNGGAGGGWGQLLGMGASAASAYFGGGATTAGAGMMGGAGGWGQMFSGMFGSGGTAAGAAAGASAGATGAGEAAAGAGAGASGGFGYSYADIPAAIGDLQKMWQTDYTKQYGAKANEQKAHDMAQRTGVAVASIFSFGIPALLYGILGKEKFTKLEHTLDPIGTKLFDSVLHGLFGQNPETYARRQVRDFLNKNLKGKNVEMIDPGGTWDQKNHAIDLGPSNAFNQPGWADKMNADPHGGAFRAVGEGLTGMLGITEEIGGQIAKVLYDNMGGSIDNLRVLMQGLGVTAQQMTDYFVGAAEKGTISWHEMEVNLQGVNDAFGEGLAAVGDYGKAFDIIVQSGGQGMDAIIGLKDSAIEAAEAGMTSFAQWRAGLLAQGKSVEYVDALFQALQQRGITSFDAIKNASNRDLGGVIADMQSLSPALANVWMAAQEAAKGLGEAIQNIPNPTDIQINVDANISDDAKQAMALSNSSTSVAGQKFATGGVVNRATGFATQSGLGIMGEAGPEAILPLSRVNGKLGVAMHGGDMGGSNVYNIDARGASPGVEANIMRALAMVEQRSVEAALLAVEDQINRGGAFAESF